MSKRIKKEKRLLIYNKYIGKCTYCGDEILYEDMHVDHIIPLQRGYTIQEALDAGIVKGSNHISNLTPSCASCNISKSTFSLEVWREQLSLKIIRLIKTNSSFRLMQKFGKIKVINKPIVFYFENNIKF